MRDIRIQPPRLVVRATLLILLRWDRQPLLHIPRHVERDRDVVQLLVVLEPRVVGEGVPRFLEPFEARLGVACAVYPRKGSVLRYTYIEAG